MKAAVAALVLCCGPILAHSQPQPSSAAELREVRHRLGLVATRAIACFHSMDSIEANLEAMGMSLNSELVNLRTRIEGALDSADGSVEKGDAKAANDALDRAEALVGRLAQKLGGG